MYRLAEVAIAILLMEGPVQLRLLETGPCQREQKKYILPLGTLAYLVAPAENCMSSQAASFEFKVNVMKAAELEFPVMSSLVNATATAYSAFSVMLRLRTATGMLS